jgi:outer membrane lipoprotein-sorting protein
MTMVGKPRSALALRFRALTCLLPASLGAHVALAAETPCAPVFDAITHLLKTPNHQFLMQTSDQPGSTPQPSEMIFTGKTTFILHDGRWQTSETTPDEALKREEENRKHSKTSCSLLRSEAVNGVNATVYTVRSESEYGISEGQVWISKADGLPLRQQIDVAVNGATGKSHVETRFVYSGVAAPPGVK